ncbi:MAG: hypothetical protein CL695_05540 [Chloroflexi bacterium]|nr:hypothetical protein [Chloroflexota bacterium]
MKACAKLDPRGSKIDVTKIIQILSKAGIEYSTHKPDFAVVVGGDGVFNYYLRLLKIPLLLVGVGNRNAVGSKAYMAETYLSELPVTLEKLAERKYKIEEKKGLRVSAGQKKGHIFTDMYLERGLDSNCLRYKVIVSDRDFSFIDYSISNGVIITTSLGSTGYYSALDKLLSTKKLDTKKFSRIREEEIGICHILPTFTQRRKNDVPGHVDPHQPLRYTVRYGAKIEIKLVRWGDARLYGLTTNIRGIRIKLDDVVRIGPSDRVAKLVRVVS